MPCILGAILVECLNNENEKSNQEMKQQSFVGKEFYRVEAELHITSDTDTTKTALQASRQERKVASKFEENRAKLPKEPQLKMYLNVVCKDLSISEATSRTHSTAILKIKK